MLNCPATCLIHSMKTRTIIMFIIALAILIGSLFQPMTAMRIVIIVLSSIGVILNGVAIFFMLRDKYSERR